MNFKLTTIISSLFTVNLEFWDCPSVFLVEEKIMSMYRTVSQLNRAVRQCSRLSVVTNVHQRKYSDMAFTFATPLKVKLYKICNYRLIYYFESKFDIS